jgi:hypothetical protein
MLTSGGQIAVDEHGSEQTPPQLLNCGGQNAAGPRSAHWASLVQGRRKPLFV